MQLPDDVESEHEAEALRFWDGRGAVQLLAHDPDHRALLLERCRPGTQLWDVPEEEAVGIGAAVLRRLWRPAPDEHSYRLLADETVRWAEQHVLRAERERWLAIDPKPIVGERAFDVASFLRDRRWEISAAAVRRRLDRLAEELELDRERMRGWGIAHALAWDGLRNEGMTAAARFLAEV